MVDSWPHRAFTFRAPQDLRADVAPLRCLPTLCPTEALARTMSIADSRAAKTLQ
jgi:hypothetical protein